MYIPDKLFLFYVYVLLPWLMFRGIRRIRKQGKPIAMSERRHVGTLITHAVLLWLAVMTARSNSLPLRYLPRDTGRAMLWALLALIPCTMWLVYRSRTAVPTDAVLPPQSMAPHGTTRWILWVMTSCSAGVVEELVWRGVGTMLLAWYIGLVPAAFVSAIAFGLVHAYQGKRGVLITSLFALLAQGLIYVTGALIPAMVVHTVYDIAAGFVLARRFPVSG